MTHSDPPTPDSTPSTDAATPPPLQPGPSTAPRWRWAIHLLLLAAYPLALGLLSWWAGQHLDDPPGPILQSNVLYLILDLSLQMVIFGLVFAMAWAASKCRAADLYIKKEPFWRSMGLGFLYSVGLRVLVAGIVLATVVVLVVASGGNIIHQLEWLRPRSEALVDTQALADKPAYLLVNLTFVSFLVAGLREELWRAGMLAGFYALFPRLNRSWTGKLLAVFLTAIVFGLGHYPQGWGGVALTTVLGIGLGVILVWRRSLLEAVLAHGFFNATSFLLMYLLSKLAPDILPGAMETAMVGCLSAGFLFYP